MASKETKFQKFIIRQGGVSAFARAIGLPQPTVHCWFAGTRTPSPENLKLIKDFSGGELSYEDIMESTAAGK